MKQKPHREGEFAVASTLRNRNLQLSVACKSGDTKAVSQLIKAKVSINTPVTRYENTPLTLACYYGFDDIVKLLVDAGADVNKKNANKKTPLQIVCSIYEGNAKKIERIVKILLKNGANPNLFKRNEDGPVHYASMYGYAEAVKLLIKHDVDVKKRGSYKRTALIYAAADSCSPEIIKSLLDAGADINAKKRSRRKCSF